jgi:hypothetical protein
MQIGGTSALLMALVAGKTTTTSKTLAALVLPGILITGKGEGKSYTKEKKENFLSTS